MISIITSVYNQLPANVLFFNSILNTTSVEWELIVVDNGSTDGSPEFFESKEHVKVIRNTNNYNYPYCQNQGMAIASYDFLCFFNNDIVLTENWDIRMLSVFQKDKRLKALSFVTVDHMENQRAFQRISRKWKRVKYPVRAMFGHSLFALKWMLKLMYNDLNKYSNERYETWKEQFIEGYSGSALVFKREAFRVLGPWDERIQAGDYDMFNRIKEWSQQEADVLPMQLAMGIYVHHFQRLTIKKYYPEFANKSQMISVNEKWGEKTKMLRKDIA